MIVFDANSVKIEQRPTIVGLPRGLFVEYFGTVSSGAEFVIFRPEQDWDYTKFQCLMRAPGMPSFVSVPISKVCRYRDGGTTVVDIQAGQFHFPTPFEPKAKPTFNKEPLTLYDSNYSTRQLM